MIRWIPLLLMFFAASACAQSQPGWTQGFVPTPAQWNATYAGKVDTTNGTASSLTLTSPIINGSVSGSPTMSGAWTFNGGGTLAGFGLTNGSLTGTFTGNTIFSGNLQFTGLPVFSGGAATFSGAGFGPVPTGGEVGGSSTAGLQILGNGSGADITFYNKSTQTALSLATGTKNWTMPGGLAVATLSTTGALANFGNAAGIPTHIVTQQNTAPALTSCGTSPAIVGTDTAGEVTMGTGTPTGCVITFNVAYTGAPFCLVTWQATPLASQSYTISNTAITLTQTGTDSNKVDYVCLARSGG